MNIGAEGAVRSDRPDIDSMAVVLEARHGVYAAHVADFFATAHDHEGDQERSRAWSRVAMLVRRRESVRLQQA